MGYIFYETERNMRKKNRILSKLDLFYLFIFFLEEYFHELIDELYYEKHVSSLILPKRKRRFLSQFGNLILLQQEVLCDAIFVFSFFSFFLTKGLKVMFFRAFICDFKSRECKLIKMGIKRTIS